MDLTEYRALVAKVDAFAARVFERYPADMTCHAGCSGCCHVQLTVCPVEAESIREHLSRHPLEERVRVARVASSAGVDATQETPTPCVALLEDGRCAIYEARPLICRTQGLPMKMQRRSLPVLDCCPLNFEGKPLEDVAPDCLLDVQTIDTMLGVVNARACASAQRIPIADVLFSAHKV